MELALNTVLDRILTGFSQLFPIIRAGAHLIKVLKLVLFVLVDLYILYKYIFYLLNKPYGFVETPKGVSKKKKCARTYARSTLKGVCQPLGF